MLIHLLARIPKIIRAIKQLKNDKEPECDFDEKKFMDFYNAWCELWSRSFSRDNNWNLTLKSYQDILDSDPELAKRIWYNKWNSIENKMSYAERCEKMDMKNKQ